MAKRYIRYVPDPRTLQRISRLHVALYRATGGLLGKRLDGLDILLLTTRGRKSGQLRTAPLPYFRDGDDYVLVASNGGNDRNPAWYWNLCDEPQVTLQVGRRVHKARARVAQGEERQRLWRHITADQPRYDDYAGRTRRQIPLVVLQDVQ